MSKKTTSGASTKVKSPKKAKTHPSSIDMVIEAVTTLDGGRKGSSLQAIKKSIGLSHQVDVPKMAYYIRQAIFKLVDNGTLKQTKGTGAAGSFKLVPKKKPAAKKAVPTFKASPKKKPAAPKTKASPKKKPAAPKIKVSIRRKSAVAKVAPKKKKAAPKSKKVSKVAVQVLDVDEDSSSEDNTTLPMEAQSYSADESDASSIDGDITQECN